MKCMKCGAELPDSARFCHICTAPVVSQRDGDDELESILNEYRARRDRTVPYSKPEQPSRSDSAPRYEENVPAGGYAAPRYEQETPNAGYAEPRYDEYGGGYAAEPFYDKAPDSGYLEPRYEDEYTNGGYDDTARRESVKKKKSKKGLWISLIALLLVIAILSGVIFIITQAKAADLKEAKENFQPPAQVLGTDDVKFTYDDRDRILSCTYTLKDREYVQDYDYNDGERVLTVSTTYKGENIAEATIPYDLIPDDGIGKTDTGYYVGTNPGVPSDNNGNNGGTVEPTDPPKATEAPAPTEAVSSTDLKDEDVSEYPRLEAFMNRYICWGPEEYDSRRALDIDRNILRAVVDFYTCIDTDAYPGSGLTSYRGDEAQQLWPWETNGLDVAAFDKTEADWICKNIFNISDAEIQTLYDRQNSDQWMYTDGESYYTIYGGKGNVVSAKLRSVKTDGKFYYVVCDVYAGGVLQNTGNYSVMELKNIDGGEYWSMYYNTANVPDVIEPFDLNG